MANHDVLAQDKDLKLFLESDTFSLDVGPLSLATLLRNLNVLCDTDQAQEGGERHRAGRRVE